MSTSPDPQQYGQRGTYVVPDSEKELTRLMIQDHLFTAGMGGVLPEQADPTIFRRVLDVGCGPGGWVIEAARTYPTMSLVGIDISKRMIEGARAQAVAQQVTDRVSFHVMDALLLLDFPTASFDLVNLRFGVSFLRTWDWPKMLSELTRVTRANGVVRLTESTIGPHSNSPALSQIFEMSQCALSRSGHLFIPGQRGLIDHLEWFLKQYGCEAIQAKAYALQYQAGTPAGQAYYDTVREFQLCRPFLEKWGCLPADYEALCQQALHEMSQPDFLATLHLLTAWGKRVLWDSSSPSIRRWWWLS
jgi:ubiquinone/menaquinone biosynthesis C-methylase UbiE